MYLCMMSDLKTLCVSQDTPCDAGTGTEAFDSLLPKRCGAALQIRIEGVSIDQTVAHAEPALEFVLVVNDKQVRPEKPRLPKKYANMFSQPGDVLLLDVCGHVDVDFINDQPLLLWNNYLERPGFRSRNSWYRSICRLSIGTR